MAQKINPISLRLEKTNRTIDSSWFNQCNYVNLLMKDLKIQWYINFILKKIKFCSARYSILHLPTKIKVNIFFYNGNKNKKYICKIFYLNYPKKTKTIRKKFFNQSHIKFSVKQNQVSNYLVKSFNNEFSNQLMLQTNSLKSKHSKNDKHYEDLTDSNSKLKKANENKKHVFLLQNALSIKNTKDNAFNLFENYLKLLYFIKSYNQFYIRYFLVKYFSIKFVFHLNGKEKLQLANENKNSNSIEKLEKVFLTENILTHKKTHSSLSSLEKYEFCKKISFKYALGFLFLQMYKNKNFLFLQYFQVKIDNYKKLINVSKKKTEKSFLQNFVYCKYRLPETKQKNDFCKKSDIFFYTNFLHLKLNILDFLKKNTYNYINSKNTKSKFKFNINSGIKPNFNGLMKLRKISYKLQLNVKNMYEINSNTVASHDVFNKPFYEKSFLQNNKHYNVSLINTECINDTYNHYCKLFQFYKHYNNLYVSANTNYKKNSSTLSKNNKLHTYVDSFQTDISTMLNKTRISERIKFILPSSPYKSHIESVLCNHFSHNINFQFFQTLNIFQNSFFLIDEVIYYIEKRVPFFKIKNYILKKLAEQKSNDIKGIRVMCSGRVGGKSKKAQRSKIQNFKYGETSLHVFSSKIDFKSKNAFTSFGTLGIKVWICYR